MLPVALHHGRSESGRMTPITFSADADRALSDWDIELEARDSWQRHERGASLFPERDTGSFSQTAPRWNNPRHPQDLDHLGLCEALPRPAFGPGDEVASLARTYTTAEPDFGEKLLPGALHALHEALKAKDIYTSCHSLRVSIYARTIARKLKLTEREVSDVGLGAEVHDIGKIGVPQALLNKDGPLTEEEYRQVMTHMIIGERILRPLFADNPTVLHVVRWHHERVDGTGLPDRLTDCEIPLAARIVAVADAFDAMTCARPYRSARPANEALRELEASAGSQLDEVCVEAFTKLRSMARVLGADTPESSGNYACENHLAAEELLGSELFAA